MSVEIVYQDEYFIVVNKPNRMLVHPSFYARNIETPPLVDIISEQLGEKYHPVHRLDHKTSGLIILCRNAEHIAIIQTHLESNLIEKRYLALLRGHTPDLLTIDSPVKNPDTGVYKEALTHLQTIHSFVVEIPVEPYPQSRYSLVCFTPKTGRMHQLRKHANKISHPIIGDYKYGNRHHNTMFANELQIPEMFLHAFSLRFQHPFTNVPLSLVAKLPQFWIDLANQPAFNSLQVYLDDLTNLDLGP